MPTHCVIHVGYIFMAAFFGAGISTYLVVRYKDMFGGGPDGDNETRR